MKNFVLFLSFILLFSLISTKEAKSLPMDWNGSVRFDSHMIKNSRYSQDTCTVANGSQCITPGTNNVRFQTMLLKLEPTILINDSASLKAEISTNSSRSSFLGGDSKWGSNGNKSYYYTTAADSSNLRFNQIYLELYADTALYRVGKFAKHFGLGAMINSGKNPSDRMFTLYDGAEAVLEVGKFRVTPVWAKIGSVKNGTNTPSGSYDVIESAISAEYRDPNRKLEFGIYYGLREAEDNNHIYGNGPQKTTLIDVYFEKYFGDFRIAMEIPMLSGKVRGAYGTNSDASIDTNAYLLETSYQMSPKWFVGFDMGIVKGDNGTTTAFEGVYLHPNYQVAKLMFRYNRQGFYDATQSIYDSSIYNTQFLKLYAHYKTNAWTWKMAFIQGTALETAKTGSTFYDYQNNTTVTALSDQSTALGQEVDFEFDYEWNTNITVSGFLGYHFVGKYYEFTNQANATQSVSSSYTTGLSLAVKF